MRHRRIALLISLLLATTAVHAKKPGIIWKTMLSPDKYDVPYTGELRIWIVQSRKDLRAACPQSVLTKGFELACAYVLLKVNKCDVYVVKSDVMRATGLAMSVALRHELAHCNGWPGDHPNGRKVLGADPVKSPNLPKGTPMIRAYPPLLCIKPDGTEESCADRMPRHPEAERQQEENREPQPSEDYLRTHPQMRPPMPDEVKQREEVRADWCRRNDPNRTAKSCIAD